MTVTLQGGKVVTTASGSVQMDPLCLCCFGRDTTAGQLYCGNSPGWTISPGFQNYTCYPLFVPFTDFPPGWTGPASVSDGMGFSTCNAGSGAKLERPGCLINPAKDFFWEAVIIGAARCPVSINLRDTPFLFQNNVVVSAVSDPFNTGGPAFLITMRVAGQCGTQVSSVFASVFYEPQLFSTFDVFLWARFDWNATTRVITLNWKYLGPFPAGWDFGIPSEGSSSSGALGIETAECCREPDGSFDPNPKTFLGSGSDNQDGFLLAASWGI